ncbi:hypothetical protein [Haliscomenobacter hydrossis]|nr:hypothetical protein [Haliscomenobacter hydrossis]
MKTNHFIPSLLVSFLFLLTGGILVAQSTNPDQPTPLTQSELRVSVPNNKTKYYYTFMLGEGELILTADVSGGTIYYEMVNEDFKAIGANSSGNWFGGTPSKRSVTRYNSIRRQKVILILSSSRVNGGSLSLRLEGSFAPSQGTSVVTPEPRTTQAPVVVVAPPATDSGNPKTITIVLKNGQTVTGKYDSRGFLRNGINNKLTINLQGKGIPEFDMNQVQSITIY